MGRTGFITMLLFVAAIVLVLLALSGTLGGLTGGAAVESAVTTPAPIVRPGAGSPGTNAVDQARRDMEAMDSLIQSVQPQ